MYDYQTIIDATAELIKAILPIVQIFAIVAFSARMIYQAFNGGKIH